MRTQPTSTTAATELLSRTPVRAAMQLGLFHCAPDDELADVARTMAEQHVHSVVVSGITRRDGAGEHLEWGIVSDLDLIGALRPRIGAPNAGEVAGTAIVTTSPLDSLAQAVQTMAENDTHPLVVVSPDTGRPVGMLSTLDVARAVAEA